MGDNSKIKLEVAIVVLPLVLVAALFCYQQYQFATAPKRLQNMLHSIDKDARKAGFEKGSDGNWSILKGIPTNTAERQQGLLNLTNTAPPAGK